MSLGLASSRNVRWRLPRLTYWLCLSLGLAALTESCAPSKRSVAHVKVTGKVLYEGKPLPGGRVMFITTNGGFAATGDIDENGTYQIEAPVGPARISVDNTGLLQVKEEKTYRLPRPPEATGKEILVKGHYVPIPPKYSSPDSSNLTYEVQPGE